MERIVYAKINARLMDERGLSYNIVEGQVWAAGDPLVRQYPDHFSDEPPKVLRTVPPAAVEVPVERAVAAPGQKRPYLRRTPKGAGRPAW